MRSTRDRLLMSLTELQRLVMVLTQSVHAQTLNQMNPLNTDDITAQIIEKQNLINEIIKVGIYPTLLWGLPLLVYHFWFRPRKGRYSAGMEGLGAHVFVAIPLSSTLKIIIKQ